MTNKKSTIRSQWIYREKDRPGIPAKTALGLRRNSRFTANLLYPDLGPSLGRWPYLKTTIVPDPSDQYYVVDPEEEYRIDAIAYKVYGSTFLWWVIALVNDIRNPFNQPEAGQVLRIPSQNRILAMMYTS